MHKCQYESRCPNEQTLDYDFCVEHLNTPRGKQHVADVIANGNLFHPSQIEAALAKAREIPDQDYQTTALERMMEALDRVLDWEEDAKRRLDEVPDDQRRFTDRKGSEQTRSEVVIYERAIDRTAKVLESASKMALKEKMVSLGKAQTELMVRIMMSVITEMRLDDVLAERARRVLLEKFKSEAHLESRVQHHVTQQLTDGNSVSIRGERVLDG